jgi:hypothetical protein
MVRICSCLSTRMLTTTSPGLHMGILLPHHGHRIRSPLRNRFRPLDVQRCLCPPHDHQRHRPGTALSLSRRPLLPHRRYQAFFTYRVWKLSGHLWLAVPAWGVATARVAFSMWAVALLAQDGVRAFASTRWLGDLALILSMCVRTAVFRRPHRR